MSKETNNKNNMATDLYNILATVFRGGNAEILFDYKWYFRIFDYLRVGLKKYILTKLRLRNKQSCKYCGRDQHIVWSCKDDDWVKLSKRWHNTALCLECFTALYPEKLKSDDIEIHGYV